MGGSITGEHGVGVEKLDYLPVMFNAEEMDCMRRLRAAFDPFCIANLGKKFRVGQHVSPALAPEPGGRASSRAQTPPGDAQIRARDDARPPGQDGRPGPSSPL